MGLDEVREEVGVNKQRADGTEHRQPLFHHGRTAVCIPRAAPDPPRHAKGGRDPVVEVVLNADVEHLSGHGSGCGEVGHVVHDRRSEAERGGMKVGVPTAGREVDPFVDGGSGRVDPALEEIAPRVDKRSAGNPSQP